jgi:hypothetical protein
MANYKIYRAGSVTFLATFSIAHSSHQKKLRKKAAHCLSPGAIDLMEWFKF